MKLRNSLRLETTLTESQMENIMKKVRDFLYSNKDCLNDVTFDYCYSIKRESKEIELNIVVEFSDFLDQIEIKEDKQCFNELNAEIMDDYMVLKCDTMVFQQRVQFYLDDLNERNKAYTKEDEQAYREKVQLASVG